MSDEYVARTLDERGHLMESGGECRQLRGLCSRIRSDWAALVEIRQVNLRSRDRLDDLVELGSERSELVEAVRRHFFVGST